MGRLATVTVRMAPELKARIQGASEREGASMNVWMVTAAEAKLSSELRSQDVDQLNNLSRRIDHIESMLGIEGGLA